MLFDIALDTKNPEPCGYAGADCLQETTVETEKSKLSDKVLQKPLEKLPKAKNNKRKNNK